MAAAFVQALLSGADKTSSTSFTISGSKTVTVGNDIFVSFVCVNNITDILTNSTCTDNLGNTYTIEHGFGSSNGSASLYRGAVVYGGTLTSHTITVSTTSSQRAAFSAEFSGVGTKGLTDGQNQTTTGLIYMGSAVTQKDIPAGGIVIGGGGWTQPTPNNITASAATGTPSVTPVLISQAGTSGQSAGSNINACMGYTLGPAGSTSTSVFCGATSPSTASVHAAGAIYSPAPAAPSGTKLFFRNSQNHKAYFPSGRYIYDLATTAGSSLVAASVSTAASGTDIQWQLAVADNAIWFVSPPLAAGFTLATTDTIAFNLWGLESNASANSGLRVHIHRVQRWANAAPEFGNSPFDRGVELSTTINRFNWTGNVSSNIPFDETDRIGIGVYLTAAGGTMASGFTATFDFNGGTSGADGDSWIQFTNTVTFATTEDAPYDILQRFGPFPSTGFGGIKGHPLCPDYAWFAESGTMTRHTSKVIDRIKGRHGFYHNGAPGQLGDGGDSRTIQKTGMGVRFRSSNDGVVLGYQDELFGTGNWRGITIVLAARRCSPNNSPQTGAWVLSVPNAGASGMIAVYVHNGVQLNFTFGQNSVDFLDYTSTASELAADNIWAFTGGTRGLETWLNGRKVASNAAKTTVVSSNNHYKISFGSNDAQDGTSDDVIVGFGYIYRAQLPPAAIQQISRVPY